MEALKGAGWLAGYKVLLVADPRAGEQDVILCEIYSDMAAALDHSTADDYAIAAKILGSLKKEDEATAARDSIRIIVSHYIEREATLK